MDSAKVRISVNSLRRSATTLKRLLKCGTIKLQMSPDTSDARTTRKTEGRLLLTSSLPSGLPLLRCQLPQHIEQYPTVLVVLNLLRCVDAYPCFDRSLLAVRGGCNHIEHAAIGKLLLQQRGQPREVIDLFACQAKAFRTLPLFELQRKNAHSHQV